MFKGLESNNKVFAQVIAEAVKDISGITSQKSWEWCFRENSTFLECPINTHNGTDGKVNMIVGAFNPSNDLTNYSSIAVPHGHYDV
jgi:3-deoxy-D-arabino-heptulosonate 7-phosphate (DAHP) synthase